MPIRKIELIIFFMYIVHSKSPKQLNKYLTRLKSFIVCKIKRGISSQENLDLLKGCRSYIKSEPGTSGRIESMEYLFNLRFLQGKFELTES